MEIMILKVVTITFINRAKDERGNVSGLMSSTIPPQFRCSQICKIMTKIIRISTERQVTLDGMMTIGMLENGLKTADFMCCENVEMEAFSGDFKLQGMRDGNVYMTSRSKRIRNKAIFRDDNASLSQGQDKRWYFYFSLDEYTQRDGFVSADTKGCLFVFNNGSYCRCEFYRKAEGGDDAVEGGNLQPLYQHLTVRINIFPIIMQDCRGLFVPLHSKLKIR